MWTDERKEKIRKIAKALVFATGLCLVVSCMDKIFTAKNSASKMTSFFDKKEDYDVLFVGISHMKYGIYPMELWQDYGIASFNLGEAGTRMPTNYWILRNALDYVSPELVVIDSRKIDVDEMTYETYVNAVFDEMPLTRTKYEAAVDLFHTWELRMEFLFPFLKYHGRWTELNKNDFLTTEYQLNRGADFYEGNQLRVAIPEEHSYIPKEDKTEGGALSIAYLRKMIELCQSRGIEVMLVELPFPADEESQRLANGVTDIADAYGIHYINFLQMKDAINFRTDMRDSGAHVNDSGAKKVTSYLGKFITETYDIPDRRNESEYDAWNRDGQIYTEYKFDRIREQSDIDKYLMLLSDKRVEAEIGIKEGSAVLEDERLMELIRNVYFYESEDTMCIQPLKNQEKDTADVWIRVTDAVTGNVEDEASFCIDEGSGNLKAVRVKGKSGVSADRNEDVG